MAHQTFFKKRKSKYNSKSQTYGGRTYQSRKEALYAQDLDLRLKAKDIKAWSAQHKVELYAYGKKICNYFVDFVIEHHDGTREYVEVKGFETNVWRIKKKMMQAYIDSEEPRNTYTIVYV